MQELPLTSNGLTTTSESDPEFVDKGKGYHIEIPSNKGPKRFYPIGQDFRDMNDAQKFIDDLIQILVDDNNNQRAETVKRTYEIIKPNSGLENQDLSTR